MRRLLQAELFPYAPFQLSEFVAGRAGGPPDPHDHDFYELFIVKSGTLNHVWGDRQEVLSADCMVLVYPRPGHTFYAVGEEKAACVNIAFPAEVFEAAAQNYSCMAEGALPPEGGASVLLTHELAKQMIARFSSLDSGRLFFKSGLTKQMLIGIVTDAFAMIHNQNRNARSVPDWLHRACTLMAREENLVAGLPRFVELCGKSQEHVTRTMARYYRQTPTAYINMLRLEQAAARLTTTSRSILEIMLDAGFENTSYFNKLFRERYHMTPSRYRANSISIIG